MAEQFQVGHMYLLNLGGDQQIVKIIEIMTNVPYGHRIIYHLLAIDKEIEYTKEPHYFFSEDLKGFFINNMESSNEGKEIFLRDMPLYVGFKTVLPKFKELLTK